MSDNIPNTLSARQAEHDPNFMLSLARGLEVLNAFTPAPAADHFPAQPENAIRARRYAAVCIPSPRWAWCTVRMAVASELLPLVLAVGHAYLAGTPLAKGGADGAG